MKERRKAGRKEPTSYKAMEENIEWRKGSREKEKRE